MPLPSLEQILLYGSVLLLMGVFGSKLSSRLGVPSLLFFVGVGMLAGIDGVGGIAFDNPSLVSGMGVVALAYILFAGGIDTPRGSITPVWKPALTLSTLGVVLTAGAVACFSRYALGASWAQGLLLGAVVSPTDAAAVFSVLRSSGIRLRGRTQALLEAESGSNDPMAVFLTLACIQLVQYPDRTSLSDLVLSFARNMTLGIAFGIGLGLLAVRLINRLKLDSEGLYPVATISVVGGIFGATQLAGGNGFLAVYLTGLVMAHRDMLHRRSLVQFHDGLSWLMQILMFLTLGLQVFPSRLLPVAASGLALALFLILVARPFAVLASLAFARMRFRQKLFVAWVGLRGASPIILATFPLAAGVGRSDELFHLVFFAVLVSVLVQGTTLRWMAERLDLARPIEAKGKYPIEYVPAQRWASEMIEIQLPGDSPLAGRRIMDAGFPKSALVILVGRQEDFLAPNGSTVLAAGDRLLVLANRNDVAGLRELAGVAAEED
jgi:cell volume regulation protein A